MRLRIPIALRWGDLDAFDHVNNATMLRLLEEARIRAFFRPADAEDAPPTALLKASVRAGALTVIARQEIEYLRPMPYRRDPAEIDLWFGRLGGSSAEICYEVYAPTDGDTRTLYARASTVMVKVDAASGAPIRLTDAERAAWQPYLEEPIAFTRR